MNSLLRRAGVHSQAQETTRFRQPAVERVNMAETAGEGREVDAEPIRSAQLQTALEKRDGASDLTPSGIYEADGAQSCDYPKRQS